MSLDESAIFRVVPRKGKLGLQAKLLNRDLRREMTWRKVEG